MAHFRVASRKSALAIQQTNFVIEQLRGLEPNHTFEVVPIVTKGDRILDVTLSKVGGKGLFVSEVEQTLIDGSADFAVHSLKDVPAELAEGLVLAGIPRRVDPRDALVSKNGLPLQELPHGARVGTSSLRRMAQIAALRSDLQIEPIRGNIDSRLRKLETEGFDAIMLAAAGLIRMGWQDRITEALDVSECIPAIGQGILGIECRENHEELVALLAGISDSETRLAADAERTLLQALNGSCQVPIGGYAECTRDGTLHLKGFIASPDTTTLLRAEETGDDPKVLGHTVAERLFALGAEDLIEAALRLQR